MAALTSAWRVLHLRLDRPVLSAILAAVLVLSLAEAAARLVKSLDPVPSSYEVPRNPRFRRDWVRYTAPVPRQSGRRLVIAIANSQGFLREEADGDLAWPKLLERRLDDRDAPGVLVANWAVPGGSGAEMILLAARAAAHRPDLVIVSAGATTFSTPRRARKPLSFWVSDATRLAYLPSVRDLLSERFLRRTQAYDFGDALAAWSALSWLRTRHLDDRPDTWSWRMPRRARYTINPFPIAPPSPRAVTTQLGELATALHRGSPDTRLLVVQMPLAPAALNARAERRAASTARVARRLFADRDRIDVGNALDLVPDEHFFSATHMDPDGHQLYAEWLEPRVRRLLDLPGD